jgi:hypothetical protein
MKSHSAFSESSCAVLLYFVCLLDSNRACEAHAATIDVFLQLALHIASCALQRIFVGTQCTYLRIKQASHHLNHVVACAC